jgi:GTP-binding protein HflX
MIQTHGITKKEPVILAALQTAQEESAIFESDLKEMQMLCATAGADVRETVVQKRDTPHPAHFFGKGKLEELKALLRSRGVQSLIVDGSLSAGQIRNLEKHCNVKIIDRSQLILDIFALHARTREAKIQVELAQLRTMYPRLTHAWSHLSRQNGGIGTRGPGEKQLEVDRRMVQRKITDLKKKLEKVERSREVQKKRRSDVFKVSLVGYTNVGKSSLLNALSGAHIKVEDELFATLDTSTKRTYLPRVGNVVISDTVGFIRKLPASLVASFKSTLEVVRDADLIVIVLDASCPWNDQQYETVEDVLSQLQADRIRTIRVINKIDLLSSPIEKKQLSLSYPRSLMISAFNGEDVERLREQIADAVTHHTKDKAIEHIIHKKSKQIQQQREAGSHGFAAQ